MIGEPRATDLDLLDLESALLRAAVGDYGLEAAVLLLAESRHWLPHLQAAGLVVIALDGDAAEGGPWAAVQWGELDRALRTGVLTGTPGQRRVLRVAASLADGQPVDLADVTAGVDRAELALVLAALAHAAGSHEHADRTGPLGALMPWPVQR